ncbi:hypothetical protein [Thiothrix nivea]|uniref:PIN domain-containing protein n=1 Tax=Thiothrix nivea (strain ATCC 35100 / DSM 5205 / JP2) TaxID=870187 RepID=A0A656HG81_THINJ|nr:hypothetical protein [Thiothrix nivea]EIJ34506.1 hypothetical protein Thini_1930 [Thiothrix nivea DSM 5205]
MLLIVDANVLIDYALADPSILGLASRCLGNVFIPRVILREVKQLDADDCERYGLTIVDEPLEILMQAANSRLGPLSNPDKVCLLLAKANQWICVTNEKPLHKFCKLENVETLWGLRLMLELVACQCLASDTAKRVALEIHRNNPRYITEAIYAEFCRKLAGR